MHLDEGEVYVKTFDHSDDHSPYKTEKVNYNTESEGEQFGYKVSYAESL